MSSDPLVYRAHADVIVQTAAEKLRELLRTVVSEIDPFPPFPGAMFSYGIEIEPSGADRGCIVLAEDGELYELHMGLDVEQIASSNLLAMRDEQRSPLDDIPPADYVSYAQRAVIAAVAHLMEQQADT